jgi:hypothetical protein
MNNKCLVQPVMLAYYVRGEGIGARVRANLRKTAACADALTTIAAIGNKKQITTIEAQQQKEALKTWDECRARDRDRDQPAESTTKQHPPSKEASPQAQSPVGAVQHPGH